MADKFIIEGAAFNGDGTSSAEATVAGGVGAWNTITYFEGATPAYGSIAAGDTVYIRSKTAAGADITRSFTSNITAGAANATVELHVRWVLDGGAVWAGVVGILTYTSVAQSITLRAYNDIFSDVRGNWVFQATTATLLPVVLNIGDAGEAKNIGFDFLAQTSGGAKIGNTGNSRSMLVSPIIKCRRTSAALIAVGNYSHLIVIDPDIEKVAPYAGDVLFASGSFGGRLEIFGGQVYGDGTSSGLYLSSMNGTDGGILIVGTDIPKTVGICPANTSPGLSNQSQFEYVAGDGGAGSAFADLKWGEADSRSDGYYPTLNALLPTTTQEPWSWRLLPSRTIYGRPFKLPSMKLYTGDDGVKTLTCNFLIADSFVAASKHSIWLEVEYVDSTTGKRKHIDSRTFTEEALDASTASWSATTYGAVNLIKRQIVLTTPTAIKKDTVVIATLRGFVKANNDNDLIFVCPDVVMT